MGDELKVPNWAFDKRRSHLYVRPEMEVCSHSLVPLTKIAGCVFMPAGDEEEKPVDPSIEIEPIETELEPADPQGRARRCNGDMPASDYEKVTVLSYPTALHSYRATKRRYDF